MLYSITQILNYCIFPYLLFNSSRDNSTTQSFSSGRVARLLTPAAPPFPRSRRAVHCIFWRAAAAAHQKDAVSIPHAAGPSTKNSRR